MNSQTVWRLVNKSVNNLPKVSAIVVSYHTGPALRDCLNALLTDPQIYEIVVVNNGNPPKDLGFLNRFADKHIHKMKLLSGHGNIGFAAGSNLGASAATGDRYLFINPDAILRRGSVAALEEARPSRGEPWIVGGRIFDVKGQEQRGGRRRMLGITSAIMTYTGLSPFERLHPIFKGMNRYKEDCPRQPVPMPVVSGALMYMSRRGFEMLSGFDEDYFLHVEDIDICRRAQEAPRGGVYYTPLAGALHHGSTSDAPSFKIEWQKAWGLGLYFRKFAGSLPEKIFAFALVPCFAALLLMRCYSRRFFQSAKRQVEETRLLFRPEQDTLNSSSKTQFRKV